MKDNNTATLWHPTISLRKRELTKQNRVAERVVAAWDGYLFYVLLGAGGGQEHVTAMPRRLVDPFHPVY